MRIETRGPEFGRCNICGRESKLTEDHVPPKGCPKVGQARLMEIMAFLGSRQEKIRTRNFQRGITYRTICAECNSALLGQQYDPELISFLRKIESGLSNRIFLPIELTTKPNRLVRSVVGHLIAHGVGLHRTGSMYEDLTDYFLDPRSSWPRSLQLFFWPYPSNDQVVIRGSASLSIKKGEKGFVYALFKFFPAAFMITVGEPRYFPYLYLRMDNILSEEIDQPASISIPISDIPPIRWPEAPADHNMVLHTDHSFGAKRG